MMNFVYGSWLVLSVIGEAVTADKIIEQGNTLGNMASASTWALVALVSVIGLIKLYRDKSKDEEDLKNIIKETTIAITKNTETLDKLNDSVSRCPKK